MKVGGGLLRWAVVHPLMQNAEIVFRWWQSEMCVLTIDCQ